MQVTLLKSKLHRASVTAVSPDYSGSLSIGPTLMKEAGFLHHEKILVGNITNGERFETYIIPAPEGSGEIALNDCRGTQRKNRGLAGNSHFYQPRSGSRRLGATLHLVGENNKTFETISKGNHSTDD